MGAIPLSLKLSDMLKHETVNRRRVWVLDNNGETIDRYTIITGSGDVYGASEHPFSPMGFGMFNHNIADEYMITTYGSNWRKCCRVRACTNEALRHYFAQMAGSAVGKPVPIASLSADVQKYISQITK